MRRLSCLVFLAAGSLAAACGGSSGSGPSKPATEAGPPTIDAGVDAPVEAAPEAAAPEAGPDAPFVDDSPQCGWTSYGEGLSGATITDLMFDTRSQPAVAYATSGSSLYISGDGGHSWRMMGSYGGGSIGFLAIPGPDPESLLASSTAGVLKSKDGGASWSLLALDGQGTSSIGVAASQTLRVYVGARGAGVLRSDDGGNTWTAYTKDYPYIDTITLDVAPDNPDEVVAGGQLLDAHDSYSVNGVVMRTTDGGASWQTVATNNGNVWNIRRCAADPTVLYAATNDGVARSADRGSTWTLMPLGSSANTIEDVEITPTNCNDVYVMGTDGPHHSTDGAKTFGPAIVQGLNLVPLGTYPGRMAVDPQRAGNVVLGNHGGVWYSTDQATWTTASGLLGVDVAGIAVSPTDPSRIWLASWGAGVWERANGAPWQRVPTTSLPVDYTFTVAPDPNVANRVLVGATTLYTSTDASQFTARGVDQNELSFAFDPTQMTVIYAATQIDGVYKSTDGGATWAASNGGITRWMTAAGSMVIDARHIVIDPAQTQTLYVGTNGGGLYKSADGGQSWTVAITTTKLVSCLLAVPGASGGPTTLYACLDGVGIQRSTDGGATWNDASGGLQTLNLNGVFYDGMTGDLYAAAGQDVYVLSGIKPWTPLDPMCNPGGPVAFPTVVQTGSGRAVVVSQGGGVMTHPL